MPIKWHAGYFKDQTPHLTQNIIVHYSNSNTYSIMPPSLVQIDVNEPLDEILRVIERDGGAIVTNFLSSELLKESMDASKSGP